MAVNYERLLTELEQELLREDAIEPEYEGELPSAAALPVSGPLRSTRFADDPDLKAVAIGQLRLGRPHDGPYPAPIRSEGPAVAKVQQALLELGYSLPSGGDGRYGEETYQAVLAFKQRFNIRTASGLLDGIVGPKTIVRLDSNFPTAEEVGCAGWESDPQSFSKVAAEHYLRSIWKPSFSVATISCNAPPPNWQCAVAVNTGAGVIVINVQLSPQDKLVRVARNPDPKNHMVCFYNYRCLADGRLTFVESSCPTF